MMVFIISPFYIYNLGTIRTSSWKESQENECLWVVAWKHHEFYTWNPEKTSGKHAFEMDLAWYFLLRRCQYYQENVNGCSKKCGSVGT